MVSAPLDPEISYTVAIFLYMLEILGYQVTTVISGKEALSLYAEQPDQFDMVILDMIMPVMGDPQIFEQPFTSASFFN